MTHAALTITQACFAVELTDAGKKLPPGTYNLTADHTEQHLEMVEPPAPAYSTDEDTQELIENSKLPLPLMLAARLEKTAQFPLHLVAADCLRKMHAAQQTAPQPLTADELREPKNGQQWRVVWWNESCRMMLPSGAKVSGYNGYRNGTMQFTIKRARGIGEQP